MQKIMGSRPAGVQGKQEKNAQGAWIIRRRKRERNGGRVRKESAQ